MASKPQLTKSQRRRRNEKAKREAAAWFDKTIGPVRAGVGEAFSDIPPNIEPVAVDQLTPEERAPSYLVDYDEILTLNDEVLRKMRSKTAEERKAERDKQIAELILRYPDRWGKPREAKTIAYDETADGNPISTRTIQRYFKLSPLKRHV